jgi:hypothetical protein
MLRDDKPADCPAYCLSRRLHMRYEKRGRFWWVFDLEGELVCVTVYKKGALEVIRRLTAWPAPVANLAPD